LPTSLVINALIDELNKIVFLDKAYKESLAKKKISLFADS